MVLESARCVRTWRVIAAIYSRACSDKTVSSAGIVAGVCFFIHANRGYLYTGFYEAGYKILSYFAADVFLEGT